MAKWTLMVMEDLIWIKKPLEIWEEWAAWVEWVEIQHLKCLEIWEILILIKFSRCSLKVQGWVEVLEALLE